MASNSPEDTGAIDPDDIDELTSDSGRLSEEKLAERRDRVFEMKQQGMSTAAIAGMFNVSERTIRRDYEAKKEELSQDVRFADAYQEVGLNLEIYKNIEEKAWREYYSLKSAESDMDNEPAALFSKRMSCLNVIVDVRSHIVELQQSTGMIPKAPRKSWVRIEDAKGDVLDEDDLSTKSEEELQDMEENLLDEAKALEDKLKDVSEENGG